MGRLAKAGDADARHTNPEVHHGLMPLPPERDRVAGGQDLDRPMRAKLSRKRPHVAHNLNQALVKHEDTINCPHLLEGMVAVFMAVEGTGQVLDVNGVSRRG